MAEHSDGAMQVQVGIFEADLKSGELRRSGVRVRLQSQPFKVLAALLMRPGEVVTREELQQQLWGADTTVDFDHSLGIAPVRNLENHAQPLHNEFPPSGATAARRATLPAAWLWVTGALVALCVALGLDLLLSTPSHRAFRVVQVTFSGHLLENDPETESFSSSASDGTRLYFSDIDNGDPVLAVALTANGESSHDQLSGR